MSTKKLKRGDVVRLITSRPAYGATFRDWKNGRPKDRTHLGTKLVVVFPHPALAGGPCDDLVAKLAGADQHAAHQVLSRDNVQFVRRPKGVRQGTCPTAASTTTTHGVTNG